MWGLLREQQGWVRKIKVGVGEARLDMVEQGWGRGEYGWGMGEQG